MIYRHISTLAIVSFLLTLRADTPGENDAIYEKNIVDKLVFLQKQVRQFNYMRMGTICKYHYKVEYFVRKIGNIAFTFSKRKIVKTCGAM